MAVVRIAVREARLRRRIRVHLKELGYTKSDAGELVPPSLSKESYRELHQSQRRARLAKETEFLRAQQGNLISHFANGSEIDLAHLRLRLELIVSKTWQSDLFRFATMLWSVPVSQGFGRRMRYLVWDDHSGKLIGLFALGDPVFNLRARDKFIEWTSDDRRDRLIHLLDGYVVGAVPPFNYLLGGKLVACLMRTKEVVRDFRRRYGSTDGQISGEAKNAHLVAVTTTSALGRSSIYNRLKLGGCEYLSPIGYTSGYGHFHFPEELFVEMRDYLREKGDVYSDNHQYGDGPNWRLRAIRKALTMLGMNPELLRHGLPREVYIGRLADNALCVLRGKRKRPKYDTLLSVDDVTSLALERWIMPRAARDSRHMVVTREQIHSQIILRSQPNIIMGSDSASVSRD